MIQTNNTLSDNNKDQLNLFSLIFTYYNLNTYIIEEILNRYNYLKSSKSIDERNITNLDFRKSIIFSIFIILLNLC